MELLLEWGIDNMFVALGNCYCWIPLLQKNMAYIGHHYPLNVKIVRLCLLTAMSSHKNQRDIQQKQKKGKTTPL